MRKIERHNNNATILSAHWWKLKDNSLELIQGIFRVTKQILKVNKMMWQCFSYSGQKVGCLHSVYLEKTLVKCSHIIKTHTLVSLQPYRYDTLSNLFKVQL